MRLAWFLIALVALTPANATQSPPASPVAGVPTDAVSGILDAFRTNRLVAVPAGHTQSNSMLALLRALISDPRFAATVNDIVVEFGSSRYQDAMDRYVRGEDVAEPTIRLAWQDAVQAGTALDNSNTGAFFRLVRDVNATLPAPRKIRVLLGDPPIDWENIRSRADYRKWEVQRDSYPADLVWREVLSRGRRALLLYANAHVIRKEILTNYDMRDWQAQTIVSLIEARGNAHVFNIRMTGSLAKWQPNTASWPPMSLTLTRGTVIGARDFGELDDSPRYIIRGVDDFVPLPKEQWSALKIEDQFDAIMIAPAKDTTATIPVSLCSDPNYVRVRLERIALVGLPPAEADVVRRLCGRDE